VKNAGCPTHNIKALKAVVIYAINYNWEEPISQPVRPTWQLLSVIRSLQPTYVKPGRLAFQSPKKLPDFLLIFRFFEIVGFLFYFVCLLISRLISKSLSVLSSLNFSYCYHITRHSISISICSCTAKCMTITPQFLLHVFIAFHHANNRFICTFICPWNK